MAKTIELELRAEVSPDAVRELIARLRERGKFVSRTRRLSVIFLGIIGRNEVDVRVRVTNGQAEVVVKKGGYHAMDRTEVSQRISPGQFLGMVRMFVQLFGVIPAKAGIQFPIKVAERATQNFALGDAITVSLMNAGLVTYVEIEKLSSRARLKHDRQTLEGIAKSFGLKVIRSRVVFDKLCRRLTETVDWTLQPSSRHFQRLERQLRQYRA